MAILLDKRTNKYYVNIQYRDQFGKLRTRKKRGFSTKREAKAWEAEERKHLNHTVFTFETLAITYFNTLEVTRATRNLRECRLHMYMSNLLPMDVRKIDRPFMNNWRVWLSTCNISTTTKNNILTLCKSIFRFGRLTYGFDDPVAFLRPFKKEPGEIKQMQIWSIDEFNTFISHISNPVYHALFRLLFWTGCRRGEALALTKHDIHPDKTITINKSFRRRIDGVGPTKNAASVRTISIDDSTYQELMGVIKATDGPYVFGGLQPISTQTVSEVFNAGIKRSGVKRVRIHDLRHSHASILLNDPTISIAAVSTRLGHNNVATTMSVYTHVIDKATKVLNNKISELAENNKGNQPNINPQK